MKFYKKDISHIFITLAFATGLFLSMQVCVKGYRYLCFSNYSLGELKGVFVEPKGEEAYSIQANYFFTVDHKRVEGVYTFSSSYKTFEAAESMVEFYLLSKELSVWYYKKKGQIFSTLERTFPYNQLVRAVIAFSVALYFLFFKSYMTRFSSSENI